MRFLIFALTFIVFAACNKPPVSSVDLTICNGSISKKDYIKFRESEIAFQRFKAHESFKLSSSLLKKYPDCYEIKYLNTKALYTITPEQAIPAFEELEKLKPGQDADIAYTLGKYYFNERDYIKTMEYYRPFVNQHPDYQFIEVVKVRLHLAEERQKIIERSKTYGDIKIEKLPPSINSEFHEYFPFLTAEGEFMIFTRRFKGQEDIFYAKRKINKNNEIVEDWSEALPLSSLNTPANEGAHCISADGKMIFFTYCDMKSISHSCDIYVSYLTDEGWTRAKALPEPVNTKSWESQPALSPDGRYLYFTSNRKGGLGKADIYRAERLSLYEWGNVINMGSGINTDGEESSPFMASDYRTLYFSSDSLTGLGGKDLFMVRKDIYGEWSEPLNLGIPFNSEYDDGTIYVTPDAESAYISTDRDGSSQLDIYKLSVPDDIKPTPSFIVKGKVIDKETQQRLSRTVVSVVPYEDSIIIASVITDVDGEFLFTLPLDHNYSLWADNEDYIFLSDNLSPQNLAPGAIVNITLSLSQLTEISESSEPIVLNNIFFDTDESTLLPSADTELNKLFKLLDENPDMHIEIRGHTDNVGSSSHNQILSLQRALAVTSWLESHGIDSSRLEGNGYGETLPVASNDTEEGRQKNRRTEFLVK